MTAKLTTVRSGALTTVQDAGRPGHAHLGVPRSGALDAPAMRLANRLLGNDPGAAVLETTLTGCALRPDRDVTVVVGGAPCPVTVDAGPVAWGAPVRVPAGSVLDVGAVTAGVRSYVAVAGGVAVEPVLAAARRICSRGWARTRCGTGTSWRWALPRGRCPPRRAPWPGPPAELVLPVRPGPRADWFSPAALRTLTSAAYRVSPHSNRIGLRTEGPPLERASTGELPSEGMVLGAVQVPPDGRPVIFLHDHPTTGGYPVVAVVPEPALAAAAQAAAGTPLRFTLA
ncbi:biotin-dependent carboxyltransferase family protein [Streptomyces sp. ARC32]